MVSLKLGLGSNLLMEPFRSFENVTEYFIHPAYNPKLKHNDVALIKLPERVEDDSKCVTFEKIYSFHSTL